MGTGALPAEEQLTHPRS